MQIETQGHKIRGYGHVWFSQGGPFGKRLTRHCPQRLVSCCFSWVPGKSLKRTGFRCMRFVVVKCLWNSCGLWTVKHLLLACQKASYLVVIMLYAMVRVHVGRMYSAFRREGTPFAFGKPLTRLSGCVFCLEGECTFCFRAAVSLHARLRKKQHANTSIC